MLGKLLKYEIPAMGRKLLPLYIAWAVSAVFLGVSTQLVDSKSEFTMVLSILLYTAVATAIVVLTIIMIVQRYSRSLLGDEAYFNQTLPVSVPEHIANKLISAIIWIVITGAVALVTGLIIMIFGGLIGELASANWSNLEFDLPKGWGLALVEMILMCIAGLTKTVMQIYAAITIGHQAADKTSLASIGAYIGILVFESFVSRLALGLFPGIVRDSVYLGSFAALHAFFLPAILGTLILSAIYFFVCKVLMEKHLNLA